ncbi:MAG: endonuclease/exonuclease/phosphatase family protein [Spirochaetales bacterium]
MPRFPRLLGFAVIAVLVVSGCATETALPTGPEMTVITHNIGDAGEGYRTVPIDDLLRVYDRFRASDRWPDVFVLQEVRNEGRMVRLSRELTEASGREYDYAYTRSFGIGILAAGRVENPRTFVAPASRLDYGAFGATVTGEFGSVDIVGVHLDPVLKGRDDRGFTAAWGLIVQLVAEVTMPTVRSRMAREIHDWIGERGSRPVVVAGDFNTVPQSSASRFMRRHYRDSLRGTDDYATGTYWKIHGPQPRVDYVYHTDGLVRTASDVIRVQAGDHYPVVASFAVPAAWTALAGSR